MSFDVNLIFTNLSIKKTIHIILTRIYQNSFFIQEYNLLAKIGASMGSCLGLVMTDIILTELENQNN